MRWAAGCRASTLRALGVGLESRLTQHVFKEGCSVPQTAQSYANQIPGQHPICRQLAACPAEALMEHYRELWTS